MILLDTHALVWLVGDPRRLSRAATGAIRDARSAGGLGVASITLWELAVLLARGHLRFAGTVDEAVRRIVEASGVTVREITPTIAALAVGFPDEFPRDPADRLIAATARAEAAPLVTRDAGIRASRLVRTIW